MICRGDEVEYKDTCTDPLAHVGHGISLLGGTFRGMAAVTVECWECQSSFAAEFIDGHRDDRVEAMLRHRRHALAMRADGTGGAVLVCVDCGCGIRHWPAGGSTEE